MSGKAELEELVSSLRANILAKLKDLEKEERSYIDRIHHPITDEESQEIKEFFDPKTTKAHQLYRILYDGIYSIEIIGKELWKI